MEGSRVSFAASLAPRTMLAAGLFVAFSLSHTDGRSVRASSSRQMGGRISNFRKHLISWAADCDLVHAEGFATLSHATLRSCPSNKSPSRESISLPASLAGCSSRLPVDWFDGWLRFNGRLARTLTCSPSLTANSQGTRVLRTVA